MTCTITSPDETVEYHSVEHITLPAFSGTMEVLPHHAECYALLQHGTITIAHNNTADHIPVTSGQCHIQGDAVLIIT